MYPVSALQYQIKAEPPPSTFPSFAKYESAWHQPWSEPVRTKRIAVALIASGLIAPVLNPNQINVNFESRWHYAWSEPIRVRPRLHASLNPFVTYTNITPVPDARLTLYRPLSEPVRAKLGLKYTLQQSTTSPPRLLPRANVTAIMNAREINTDILAAAINVQNAAEAVRVAIKEYPSITETSASIEET